MTSRRPEPNSARLLGRKTMAVEIFKEALAKAQAKKPSLQLASPPKDAFR
jgi:transposase